MRVKSLFSRIRARKGEWENAEQEKMYHHLSCTILHCMRFES